MNTGGIVRSVLLQAQLILQETKHTIPRWRSTSGSPGLGRVFFLWSLVACQLYHKTDLWHLLKELFPCIALGEEQPGRVVLAWAVLCPGHHRSKEKRDFTFLLVSKSNQAPSTCCGEIDKAVRENLQGGLERKGFREKPGVPAVCPQTGLSKSSTLARGSTSSDETSQCWVPLPFIQNRN